MDNNLKNQYSYMNNHHVNNPSYTQNTKNPPINYRIDGSIQTSYASTDYIRNQNLSNPQIKEITYSNTSYIKTSSPNISYSNQNKLYISSNDALKNVNAAGNNVYSTSSYGISNGHYTNLTNTNSINANLTSINSPYNNVMNFNSKSNIVQTNVVLSSSGNSGSYSNINNNPSIGTATSNAFNPNSVGNSISSTTNSNNNFDSYLINTSAENISFNKSKNIIYSNNAPLNLISTNPTNSNVKISYQNPFSDIICSSAPNPTYNYNFTNIDFDKIGIPSNINLNSVNNKINKIFDELKINKNNGTNNKNVLASTGNNVYVDSSTHKNINQDNKTNFNNSPITLINYQTSTTSNIITINPHIEANKEKQNDNKIKKFSLNDFIMLKTLGKGAFGRVRIGQNKLTGNSIAIKALKKSEIIKKKQGDHILNEIKILNLVDHPFSVKFNGFSQDSRFIYLGLELINGGELFTYLRTNIKLPLDQSRFYIAHIVLLFEYMHAKNIIYRDLKPENVLIDKYGYLKLTDMGLAKVVDSRTYTFCGTPEYMSPEIVSNKGYGKFVDWWATGILLYELLVGIDPFNDESGDAMKIFNNILTKNIAFPRELDTDAKSLIKHLCDKDLTKRYGNLKNGVLDIKNHRFFNNFNFDDLLNRRIRPAYIPPIKGETDTSQFMEYPESATLPDPLTSSDDIFSKWFD